MSDTVDIDFPERVIVDQHGHYWRDYGTHWSMCPVSDENVATTIRAIYLPLDESHVCPPHALSDAWAAAEAAVPASWPTDRWPAKWSIHTEYDGDGWQASVGIPDGFSTPYAAYGTGPTPAAALLDLAERLRAADAPRSGEVGR